MARHNVTHDDMAARIDRMESLLADFLASQMSQGMSQGSSKSQAERKSNRNDATRAGQTGNVDDIKPQGSSKATADARWQNPTKHVPAGYALDGTPISHGKRAGKTSPVFRASLGAGQDRCHGYLWAESDARHPHRCTKVVNASSPFCDTHKTQQPHDVADTHDDTVIESRTEPTPGCPVVLKSGKRKGQPCGNPGTGPDGRCSRHTGIADTTESSIGDDDTGTGGITPQQADTIAALLQRGATIEQATAVAKAMAS